MMSSDQRVRNQNPNRSVRIAFSIALIGGCIWCAPSFGQEPLQQVVDAHLSAPGELPPVRCSDLEFMRRVSLDLIGMPPSADEARVFLKDASPDKRAELVDRLLVSPEHVRHLATTIDVMLMERRANKHITQDDWINWLRSRIERDTPWNETVRLILAADGDDADNRAAARFYLDRDAEPNLIARDLGRIFFGMDLQCAQCHDSPLVSDYLQSDYKALQAFVAPGVAVKKKKGDKELTVFAERSGTDIAFESVFNQGVQHRMGPALPSAALIEEPFHMPGEEYSVAPADKVRSVPKFSRRESLAATATDGTNRAFNLNIANRLWAMMFGRGLIHPPDMIHMDNAGSGYPLLNDLAESFASGDYRIRPFLRGICLSQAYQRPFDLAGIQGTLSGGLVRQPTITDAATLDERVTTASNVYDDAYETFDEWEEQYVPLYTAFDKARTQYAETQAKHSTAESQSTQSEAALATQEQLEAELTAASAAAMKAQQLLGEDPQILAVTAALDQTLKRIKSQLSKLTKAREEKTAALKALTQPFEDSRDALQKSHAALAPVMRERRIADIKLVAARTELQALSMMASARHSIEEAAGFLEDVSHRTASINRLNHDIATLTASAAEHSTRLASIADTLTDIEKQDEQLHQESRAADAEAAAAQDKLTASESVIAALETAEDALQNANLVLQDNATTGNLQSDLVALRSGWIERRDALMTEMSQQSARCEGIDAQLEQLAVRQRSTHAAMTEIQAEAEQLNSQLAKKREEVLAASAILDSEHDRLIDVCTDRFLVAPMKPLTPEQMCWSTLKVTGVYDRYVRAEAAAIEKESEGKPPTDDAAEQNALPGSQLEQRTYNKLKNNLTTWIKLYGNAAGQPQSDFFASADQALFMANGNTVLAWLAPNSDNPVDRMVKTEEPRLAAEELYLGILTRMPTESEIIEVTEILSEATDRSQACQSVAWGLLNSAEFRFNH